MRGFNANSAKELAAKEAGFQKTKIIPLEMYGNGVFLTYVRFEVCGRVYSLLYNEVSGKYLLDLCEGDYFPV